ncbi:MAG TPA: hypothetical protein DF715_15325 [Oceanicaulis sp.]|jgi:hypothetical protein|nr:hypothetical protein [Oceanicaulis sp.]
MYDFSLQLLLAVFAVFILACLGYGLLRLRALSADAREEYADRAATKPATVRGVSEGKFVSLYVKSFAPRWAFYLAAGCAIAIVLSPVALVIIPAIYDQIWRATGAHDWAGRGGYVFMFTVFFGVVAFGALPAFVLARLHHTRAPEPFTHALARARGEPIPEETGWRRRPKWARRVRPDTDADADSSASAGDGGSSD